MLILCSLDQCGFICLLGHDQKIETKLGYDDIMSQNTIVQLIGLMEWQTYIAPVGHNLYWELRIMMPAIFKNKLLHF